MNKKQFKKKNLFTKVLLLPPAKRFHNGQEIPAIDDTWIIMRIRNSDFEIRNIRTMHTKRLEYGHCHSYDSDRDAPCDGLKHGKLKLQSQISLAGSRVTVKPLAKEERIY